MRSSAVGRRTVRALRKPPRELARRLFQEVQQELERVRAPRRARRLDEAALLRATDATSVDALWERLASRPYLAVTSPARAREVLEATRTMTRVRAAADRALAGEVDVLGSGPTRLGSPIDWHTDFKTGLSWPLTSARSIDFADLRRPSDVKVPWELSRGQWMLPAAQAYLLTGEERYAACVRDVLDQWIGGNPHGVGINWVMAMEAALRAITWTFLFHALAQSETWSDAAFRRRFLTALYMHGDFVSRNLERSDVNGNHYDAGACGLVFTGLFFGSGEPAQWAEAGWRILIDELPRQVFDDGVDFEGSTAYHRLVTELFLLPALYRSQLGLEVPHNYKERVRAMAAFAATYTRSNGTSPLWGDADDARVLPLGSQPLADHRYLAGLAGSPVAGPRDEIAWILGAKAAAAVPEAEPPQSTAFRDGGAVVMRNNSDHVFIDCGFVGLAGRGGHGHNDCLAFEAELDGVLLISDSGSYVYTASPEWRNRFRSTGFHSTPRVDGEEQNRFVPGSLWLLHDDVTPELRVWEPGPQRDRLVAAHGGYRRLGEPVTPVRTFELDHARHRLVVSDAFEGYGEHLIEIPLQFANGVNVALREAGVIDLGTEARTFQLQWSDPGDWALTSSMGWISPSYGVKLAAARLEWRRQGSLRPLSIEVEPL